MASPEAFTLTPSLPASFDRLLDFALDSPAIAGAADALGIPAARLAAIPSRRRALERAGQLHAEWHAASLVLKRHAEDVGIVRAHVLHPVLPIRAYIGLRRRLPGGAAFRERLAHKREERIYAIDHDPQLSRMRTTEQRLREECLDVLYEQGILRPLRAFVDERSDRAWSTKLTLSSEDAPGLAELRSSPSVPLAAITEVEALIGRMPGGSIGVSGPRGVGKTTLIRWFAREQTEPWVVGAYVSAPTEYDARDFVLHLFGTLCTAVITATTPWAFPDSSRPVTAARGAARQFASRLLRSWGLGIGLLVASLGLVLVSVLDGDVDARLLAGVGCLGASVAAGVNSLRWYLSPRPPGVAFERRYGNFAVALCVTLLVLGAGLIVVSQLSPRTPLWLWGALGAFGGLALLIATWPQFNWRAAVVLLRPHDARQALVSRAHDQLDMIRFQVSLTSGWAATVKLPLLEGGRSGDRTLATRPMTLPELVAELERFIRDVAQVGRVVIGIDELDKMETEAHVHRFLNEIKGIFGIRDCFFLVSVSEEAMSNFARRDAGLRDAFDSAFDEIVHVPPLDLGQSRAVLSERVIGLPVQLAALCHVLSGGLPRDLIRVTRAVLALNPPGQTTSLADVVHAVIAREIAVRTRAAPIAIRALGPRSTRFADWLVELETAGELLELVFADDAVWNHVRQSTSPEREQLSELVLELQGFCYFALTLKDVFDDDLDRTRFEEIQAGRAPFDALAHARTTFSVNAMLAWAEISAFRHRNGLNTITPPDLRFLTPTAARDPLG